MGESPTTVSHQTQTSLLPHNRIVSLKVTQKDFTGIPFIQQLNLAVSEFAGFQFTFVKGRHF